MVGEALRSGDTVCDVERYRHGIIRGGAQPQHWIPPGYKQLTHGHLNKCKPGVGET